MTSHNLDSFPDSLDSSPREDYSTCIAEYAANSKSSIDKINKFFTVDKNYKSLQQELYDLLSEGDRCWDYLRSSKCTDKRAAASKVNECVKQINVNLDKQEKTVRDVKSALQKSSQALTQTNDRLGALNTQIDAVRNNLKERVKHMAKIQPAMAEERRAARYEHENTHQSEISKRERSGSSRRDNGSSGRARSPSRISALGGS